MKPQGILFPHLFAQFRFVLPSFSRVNFSSNLFEFHLPSHQKSHADQWGSRSLFVTAKRFHSSRGCHRDSTTDEGISLIESPLCQPPPDPASTILYNRCNADSEPSNFSSQESPFQKEGDSKIVVPSETSNGSSRKRREPQKVQANLRQLRREISILLVSNGYPSFLTECESKGSGNNAVVFAAQSNKGFIVKMLAEKLPNLLMSRSVEDKQSPLMYAISFQDVELAKWIIQKQPLALRLRDADGWTPAIAAGSQGQEEILKLIAETDRDSLNLIGRDETSVMQAVATSGNLQLLRWLVEEQQFDPLQKPTGKSSSAFLLACFNGHMEIVQYLVDERQLPELLTGRDVDGNTALLVAAFNGHLALVQWLVNEKKVPLGDVNNSNNAAVHVALLNGKMEVAEWLLRQDEAEKSTWKLVNDEGYTPLLIAAGKADSDSIVKWMVEKDGSLLQQTLRAENWPALHVAAFTGNLSLVKWLIKEKGVAMDDFIGDYTPLLAACFGGSLVVVQWLVEEMAQSLEQVTAPPSPSNSPLLLACSSGNLDLVKWLIKKNCDDSSVLYRNDSGFSPLLMAAQNDHVVVMDYLHSCLGHFIDQTTYDGWTPLLLAAHNGRAKAVRWLLLHGADVNRFNIETQDVFFFIYAKIEEASDSAELQVWTDLLALACQRKQARCSVSSLEK